MSKRAITELQASNSDGGESFQKFRSVGVRRETDGGDSDMGEFEDPYEDENESDEDVVDGSKDENDIDEEGVVL